MLVQGCVKLCKQVCSDLLQFFVWVLNKHTHMHKFIVLCAFAGRTFIYSTYVTVYAKIILVCTKIEIHFGPAYGYTH